MILFSLPDYHRFYRLNLSLLEIMDKEPEKFYEDIKIDSIYGSFPCIWNGGRYYDAQVSYDNIVMTVKPFMERGISLRHTFTNCLLTQEHFSDTLCNKICELTHSPLNGINVTSPELKQYLEERYPQFYYMWSTTLGFTNISTINEYSQNNLLVLDYSLNNKFEILKTLQHPNNIEILLGETCIDNCPKRLEHYQHNSNCQLYNTSSPYNCPFVPNQGFYQTKEYRQHWVTVDEIRSHYLPLGINKFKIAGRGRPVFEAIENYVHYLVQPEWRDDIRNQLLLAVLGEDRYMNC